MNCNHCAGKLERHDGMQHCLECGCYFVSRTGELAADHTPCREAQRRQLPISGQSWSGAEPEQEDSVDDEEGEEGEESPRPGVTPIPLEMTKGGKAAPEGEEVAPEDTETPEKIVRKKA